MFRLANFSRAEDRYYAKNRHSVHDYANKTTRDRHIVDRRASISLPKQDVGHHISIGIANNKKQLDPVVREIGEAASALNIKRAKSWYRKDLQNKDPNYNGGSKYPQYTTAPNLKIDDTPGKFNPSSENYIGDDKLNDAKELLYAYKEKKKYNKATPKKTTNLPDPTPYLPKRRLNKYTVGAGILGVGLLGYGIHNKLRRNKK